jgi:hypothetical protein
MSYDTFVSMFCCALSINYQLEKKIYKKVQKNNFEKMLIFGLFGENRLWTPQVGGSLL